jgi:uncharacterized protein
LLFLGNNNLNKKDLNHREIALITGASSGIGYEFALQLGEKNYDLILTARNAEKLQVLKDILIKKFSINVVCIAKDLSRNNSSEELYTEIKLSGSKVTLLINNAGFAEYGEFLKTNTDKELQMIHLNISSLTALTKYFLIDMKKENYGRILNIASVLSFFPMPLFAVYAATKSYVLSFSEALSNELRGTNITVSCLCPGPTRTHFSANTEIDSTKAYKLRKQAEPKDVANLGLLMVLKGKRTEIYGFGNKVLAFSTRFGTRGLVLKIASFIGRK